MEKTTSPNALHSTIGPMGALKNFRFLLLSSFSIASFGLMKKFLVIFSLLVCSASVSCAQSAPRNGASPTFECADSLDRADGQARRSTLCQMSTEYCYEATGGTALSHGAQCRLLPKDNPTCSGLVLLPGGSCTGDVSTGIRVNFAYP
jgi:hypothetical protein